METLRTIKYNEQTGGKMNKIAQKLGRPNRLVFAQMVDYFFRCKKDPLDFNDELLKNTLLKQHKDHIGFIRVQEKDLLIPIKTDVSRMITSQENIDNFLKELEQGLEQLTNRQNELSSVTKSYGQKLQGTDEILKGISSKLAVKEQLKKQFHYILSTFIKNRDAFNMMTPTKDKEELIKITRNQIDLL
ncbi:BfmA/BtgA family mobilization protein [Pedobacter agri]|uniref:BfmA/BtgA family mobilization protein n=1 Tax=Pedobacter agri TaxID=454586 RepID=A0A9X3DAP0_9SPHI|nr:BfmA/BtgA family mobilization protein [Pedobacter agri]MCX3264199.1 BfmA/BtgA family mobilization protein [Pedobacter agri]